MIKNMAEYLPKPRKKEDIEKELKAERKKREVLKAKESIAALGTLAQDFYVADSSISTPSPTRKRLFQFAPAA